MNQGDNHFFYNSVASDDSFFTAIGKAAEEEMLRECGHWEQQAEAVDIPENVEIQILALDRKHEYSAGLGGSLLSGLSAEGI